MKDKTTPNETGWVCAAQEGDKRALCWLMEHNWAWLRALVYSVLGDAQDIDDVLQDVCVRVITKVATLREPERFRAWLAVLARREALKYRRRKPQRPLTDAVRPISWASNGQADGPLEALERTELCSRVGEVVNQLPQPYRDVFVLVHTGELTYAQTAEILDIPITTMQIRLVRARRMVRDQITSRSDHHVRER